MNVNESHDSWIIQLIRQRSGKSNPVGVMRNANKWLFLTIIGTGNRVNDKLERFLNENDVI